MVLVTLCVIFGRGSVGVWSRGVVCHFLGLGLLGGFAVVGVMISLFFLHGVV